MSMRGSENKDEREEERNKKESIKRGGGDDMRAGRQTQREEGGIGEEPDKSKR